jgi:hypothetical protein
VTGDKQIKMPALLPGQSKKLPAVTITAPAAGKGRVAYAFDSACTTFKKPVRPRRWLPLHSRGASKGRTWGVAYWVPCVAGPPPWALPAG